MLTIKRFGRMLGMALSALLLLALTVAPVFAGGKYP